MIHDQSIDASLLTNLVYWAVLIICALVAIIGTLLGIVLHNQHRSRKSVEATLSQVANNHVDEDGNPINMRDDLDEKFAGMAGLIKNVIAAQETQGKDIGGIRSDLRQVATRYDSELDDTRSRLRVLEATKRTVRRRPTKPKENQ